MTLEVSRDPVFTPRLELRRTRLEDAPAMFEAQRDPEMYAFIPRQAPQAVADLEARFARIMQETAAGRDDQWLNWTVWLRENGQPLGMVEATVSAEPNIQIGYMFDPRVQRRGFASEAVAAMLEQLALAGARGFEAWIDRHNVASIALVIRLGFRHAYDDKEDQVWTRDADRS